MTTATTAKILGYDYTMGACDCCGREGLKKTVILAIAGRQSNYGVGCAAAALREDVKVIRREAKVATDAREVAERAARAAADRASMDAWASWYQARTGCELGSRAMHDRGDLAALRAEYRAAREAA